MEKVSYLTINGETREIVDSKNRDQILLLQEQIEENTANIEYIARILDINLDEKE